MLKNTLRTLVRSVFDKLNSYIGILAHVARLDEVSIKSDPYKIFYYGNFVIPQSNLIVNFKLSDGFVDSHGVLTFHYYLTIKTRQSSGNTGKSSREGYYSELDEAKDGPIIDVSFYVSGGMVDLPIVDVNLGEYITYNTDSYKEDNGRFLGYSYTTNSLYYLAPSARCYIRTLDKAIDASVFHKWAYLLEGTRNIIRMKKMLK